MEVEDKVIACRKTLEVLRLWVSMERGSLSFYAI